MSSRSLVIFDLDGTLIDSRLDLALSINLVRSSLGLPELPEPVVTGYLGDGIRNLVKRCFQDVECNLDDVVKKYSDAYREHLLDNTTLYPNVKSTLDELAAAYNLCVVTNKPEPAAIKILKGLDIFDDFDAVIGGGRCQHLKPHPEPILKAIQETNSKQEGSWIVGDHRTDLKAAENTGLKSVFCKFGFGIMDTCIPDYSIESFEELTKILLNK